VFLSKVKEPYFFGSDLALAPYWGIHNEADYLALFAETAGAKRIGEASVWYLYSAMAAREIKEFSPSAKIIIMVRNPVDVLYSLHGQFLRSYNEDIISFEEALDAEEDRRSGARIPDSAHFPRGLIYRDVVRFSAQVERYFNVFGRENVFVVVFDDFARDTAVVYERVLQFLDIDSTFRADLKLYNKSMPIYIRPSLRYWKTHPRLRRRIDMLMTSYPRRLIGKLIDSMARPLDRPSKMTAETRARLLQEFAEEIESLGRLLNRDLSHWQNPPAARPRTDTPHSP
jgi:hypothetical protein